MATQTVTVRLNALGRSVRKQVEGLIKKGAAAAYRELVKRTPVDSGRARCNWIPTVKEPSNRSNIGPGPFLPGGAAKPDIAAAIAEINKFKLEDGTLYLTNNVQYIQELEDGSSKQAPHGFAEQSAIKGAAVIAASAFKLGSNP